MREKIKVDDLRKGVFAVYGDCPECMTAGNRKNDNPKCVGCGVDLDYSGEPRIMHTQSTQDKIISPKRETTNSEVV